MRGLCGYSKELYGFVIPRPPVDAQAVEWDPSTGPVEHRLVSQRSRGTASPEGV